MRSELRVGECGSKGTVITAATWMGLRIIMLTAYFCCFGEHFSMTLVETYRHLLSVPVS